MAEYTIFTRAYSKSSAGRLSSAKGPTGDSLTHTELLKEFRNHANKESREPTALISVSNRIIDTVRRAFDKYYTDGESPEDIWIAFITVPGNVQEFTTSVHAAELLAKECEFQELHLFCHEYVFEWLIPDKYVSHKVSLRTLLDRGLDWEKHLFADDLDDQVVPTSELRRRISMILQPEHICYGISEVGFCLGRFAQKFGARAPLDWIANQLFYDCAKTWYSADEVTVKYACGSSETFDFDFTSELQSGIDTILNDWWLDFCIELHEFNEWRDVMEIGIIEDEADFWVAWHTTECGEIVEKLSECETRLLHEAWDQLLAKHEGIWSDIEMEAVKIGL